MIVVEGMDNSGKTTLIKHLVDKFGLCIEHSPSELRDTPDLQRWVDETEQKGIRPHIICDRHPYISERVYGSVLRGSVNLTDYDSYWAKHHLLIYCRPPVHKITDFGKRAQMKGVKKNAIVLIKKYDEEMRFLQNKCWHLHKYDYTQPPHVSKVGVERGVEYYLEVGGIVW